MHFGTHVQGLRVWAGEQVRSYGPRFTLFAVHMKECGVTDLGVLSERHVRGGFALVLDVRSVKHSSYYDAREDLQDKETLCLPV